MWIIKNKNWIFLLLMIFLCVFTLSIFLFLTEPLNSVYKDSSSTETDITTENILITESIVTTENATNSEFVESSEQFYNTESSLENSTEETPSINDVTTSVTNDETIINDIESTEDISPSEHALLDAGLGNVVLLPTGDYGILMQSPDHAINGKRGNEILRDYLASIGLEGSIYGGWMNDQYYNFFAENVHELISLDEEEFWD